MFAMGPNVARPERPVRVRKLALDLRPIEQRLERGIDRLRLFLQVGEARAPSRQSYRPGGCEWPARVNVHAGDSELDRVSLPW